MGTGDDGRLRAIVTEVTAERGYDLEELTTRAVGRRRTVRVVIDADGGVSLDDAAEVSRAISEKLDGADDPMGEQPYTLEVTSPGIGRQLREPRHFRRARGRLVMIDTADGPVTGHLVRTGDSAVELAVVDGRGAGKGTVRLVEVPYSRIAAAKVEVEFSAPPASVQKLLESAPSSSPDGGAG